MNFADVTPQELERLDALHRLRVLDTPSEAVFDALAEAAAQMCGVPIALVSLVDAERQWFKANVGLPGVTETPRSVAFCDHAIRGDGLLEICDALVDARVADNPLVTGEPHIRFYAGAPIVMPEGKCIGTVCVIDREPRRLSATQRAGLQGLGRIASETLAARGRQVATTRRLATSEARYRAIVDDQTEMISLSNGDGTLSFVNPAYAKRFGLAPDNMIGRNLLEFVEPADRDAVRDHLAATWQAGVPVSNVNRVRDGGARTRWIAWTNRPMPGLDGRPAAMQSVGRDITDQKSVEQALEDSEMRYRSLYESTPAILHSIDAAGRLLTVTDLWLRVFGYARAEVIGRPSSEFLAPASARYAREHVMPDFFRSGRCEDVEYQFVHKDGHLIDIRLSAILERDAAGAPARSLAVLEDMSDAKRMAADLVSTHAQLDAIVENVPALLGHWNEDGITRFANREFQAAVGLPLEQIVGQPLRAVYDAVDPQAYEKLAPHIAEVLKGRRQEFELPMLTTSGLRQLRLTLVPDRRSQGEVAGFYGMAHDITGRKALELRLRDSELRYRSLFDHLNSGFALHEIIVDAAGKPIDYKFLAMNAAFAALSGLTPETAIGRRVTVAMPGIEADPGNWIGVYGEVALSGRPTHFEQRLALHERWFDVVAYRPAPGQFAVIVQDITQRKLADAQLQAALGEKETLLKEVYHRVKNNLQVVQSLLSLQRRSTSDEPARAALEESVQRVRAMALVHEKLYQSGSLAAVSLPDYTRDLLKQIGEATGAGPRGIVLRAEIAPLQTGLDSAIPFGLLVTELVTNALKHGFAARRSGEVRVVLVPADGGTLLEVDDDGDGIAASFSLDVPTMGLQLAISLARQLGGDLQFANRRGALFTALLTRL